MPATDFHPLRSNEPLIVYFDYKSPYAFVAKDPTYALADELQIAIDWRPLTLDIPSYLGSARLDQRGKVAASNRTPQQWSGVRYAYKDARRYAAAYGYGLRGTEKIWDTSLIHLALSWVQQQLGCRDGSEIRAFHDLVYRPFWLRELDVEDMAVVCRCIEAVGVSSAGFDDWVATTGRAEQAAQQAAIFDAGIFGVPGFVVGERYFFGREHLGQVAALLRTGEPQDVPVANPLPATLAAAPGTHDVFRELAQAARAGELAVQVAVDVGCPQSYLGVAHLLEIAARWPELRLEFLPLPRKPLLEPTTVAATAARGERHRAFRAAYRLTDLERYAAWSDLPGMTRERLLSTTATDAAAAALLWVRTSAPARQVEVLQALFAALWLRSLDVAAPDAVREVLAELDLPVADFDQFVAQDAATALAATTQWWVEQGVPEPFGFVALGQPFNGRQHLAALDWACDQARL